MHQVDRPHCSPSQPFHEPVAAESPGQLGLHPFRMDDRLGNMLRRAHHLIDLAEQRSGRRVLWLLRSIFAALRPGEEIAPQTGRDRATHRIGPAPVFGHDQVGRDSLRGPEGGHCRQVCFQAHLVALFPLVSQVTLDHFDQAGRADRMPAVDLVMPADDSLWLYDKPDSGREVRGPFSPSMGSSRNPGSSAVIDSFPREGQGHDSGSVVDCVLSRSYTRISRGPGINKPS